MTDIKNQIRFDLINFSGDGKQLQSSYFQEKYEITDPQVRKLIRDIVVEEEAKDEPQYIFGSTNEGFMICKTEEEMDHAISYLFSKADKIYERARKLAKTKERITQNKFEPKLF